MKRSKIILSALLLSGVAATGCTSPNNFAMAPLDMPAEITASGAHPQSQVTIYRKGVLDPRGSLVVLKVKDASVRFSTTADKASVEELTFKLGDADMTATESMPEGVNLRNQQLRIVRTVEAPMVQRDANAVTVRAHTSLQYSAALVLDDGSLYTLGNTETEAADVDVRATRYEFGVHVTVDAAPQGKCWEIPGVIEVSDCSLYVEADGDSSSN